MSWASTYIARLRSGHTVQFRPKGHSMSGRIENGQLVTVQPLKPGQWAKVNDVVLCTVHGRHWLHKVLAVEKGRCQIGNNRGHVNGWCETEGVFGVVVKVEP